MNFHVLTLFPEMIIQGLENSITGRAIKEKTITVEAVNIRDFTKDKHRKVDDYPYGGGAGMLMQAQPVYDAIKSVEEHILPQNKRRVIYVTPQGKPFNQKMAMDFAKNDDLLFLCGHYEGIDERVLEEVVTDYVSIGDYVLTGGELAAMVMIDAISRLVPGVLNNEVSAETESFQGELLEYPQYSRPEVWMGKKVPEVLLSGNQKKIREWRLEQSIMRTKERRPDLYQKYEELQQIKERLMSQKLLHIDMIEKINRSEAILLAKNENEILLQDIVSKMLMHTCLSEQVTIETLVSWRSEHPEEPLFMFCHQREAGVLAEKELGLRRELEAYQAVYTQREKASVAGLYRPDGKEHENGLCIRLLEASDTDYVWEHYKQISKEYVEERILAGQMWGAYLSGELVGFVGIHEEGSVGMLFVEEKHRFRKIGKALQTYALNYEIEQGHIPFGQVAIGNEASVQLQSSLGLYLSKISVCLLSNY